MEQEARVNKDKLWTKDFIILAAVNFCGSLLFYLLMVVMTNYSMETYGVSYSLAALSFSVYIIGALATRIVLGKQTDIWGIKKTLIIGSVINAVMAASYLIPMPYFALIIARFTHGIGFALTSGSAAAAAALVVPASRKVEGISYFSLTNALATGIGPFVSIALTQNGSYFTLFVFTAIMGAIALVGAFVPRIPKPAEHTSALTEANEAPSADVVIGKSAFARWVASFVQISALPLGLVMLLMYISYAGVLSFVVPFANENGMADAVGVYFLVYSATILVSRPPIGRLVDRRGENPIIYITLMTLAVGLVVLALAASGMVLLSTAVLIGFGLGSTQSTLQAVMARDPPAPQLGRAHSTFFAMMDLGSGVGPIVIGAFIPIVGYRMGYMFLAGLTVVTCLTYHLVHGRYVKERRAKAAAAAAAKQADSEE